jgi:hypothetical protein
LLVTNIQIKTANSHQKHWPARRKADWIVWSEPFYFLDGFIGWSSSIMPVDAHLRSRKNYLATDDAEKEEGERAVPFSRLWL